MRESRTRRSDGWPLEEGGGGELGEGGVCEPLVLEASRGLLPPGVHAGGDVDEDEVGGGDAEEVEDGLVGVAGHAVEVADAEVGGVCEPVAGPDEEAVADEAGELADGGVGEEVLVGDGGGQQLADVRELVLGGVDHDVLAVVEEVAVVVVVEVRVELAPRAQVGACKAEVHAPPLADGVRVLGPHGVSSGLRRNLHHQSKDKDQPKRNLDQVHVFKKKSINQSRQINK